MAVEYLDQGNFWPTTSDTSMTVGSGSAIVYSAGDLLFMIGLGGQSSSPNFQVNTPSGWTKLGEWSSAYTALQYAIFWKIADADSGTETNPQMTVSVGTGGWGAMLVAVSGADATNPVEVGVNNKDIGSTTSNTAQGDGLTTLTDGSLMLSILMIDDDSFDYTVDEGFTHQYFGGFTNGNDSGIVIASKEIPTAGAVTSPTFTAVSTDRFVSIIELAIKPTGAAAPSATFVPRTVII